MLALFMLLSSESTPFAGVLIFQGMEEGRKRRECSGEAASASACVTCPFPREVPSLFPH